MPLARNSSGSQQSDGRELSSSRVLSLLACAAGLSPRGLAKVLYFGRLAKLLRYLHQYIFILPVLS